MRLRREQIRALIKDCVIEAIRNRANDGFMNSQVSCPVVTGKLKSSGNVIDIENGAQLQYTAEYSSNVEKNWSGGRIYVGAYNRKDGTRVKGYNYYSPPREGKHFIENALKDSFKTLNSELDMRLRGHFKNITRV